MTEYCVKETAIDAQGKGVRTYVVRDAVKAVELNEGDGERAFREMEKAGVKVVDSGEITG